MSTSGRIGIRLTTRVSVFRDLARRASDLSPIMAKAVPLIRDSVAREFRDGAWFPPAGGRQRWAPIVPFGTRKRGNEPALIESGRYFNALMGRGAGSFVQIGPRSVSVGVQPGLFPYAEYIRGGRGATLRRGPLIIRPRKLARGRRRTGPGRWAMFWYLGLNFGVWLKESTLERGLRLPPRPHLTRNPALVNRIASMVQRELTKGILR